MAFSTAPIRRVPFAAAALATCVTLYHPRNTLYTETPLDNTSFRKPIYDEFSSFSHQRQSSSRTDHSPSRPASQTITNRLAAHIRRGRLFVHAHISLAEDGLNTLMSTFLAHERSFTSTIASLAPPPESRERLLPGALYVIVAAMAGSIVSRNRNIALRATVPAAIGLGAAWVVLPVTMRNVGDLIWTYEKKVPLVSENHLRVRGAAEEGVRESKKVYMWAQEATEKGVRAAHQTIEGWVRKGKQ